MEEYIKEAPRAVDAPAEPLVYAFFSPLISDSRNLVFLASFSGFFYVLMKFVCMQLLTYRPDDGLPSEDTEPSHEESEALPSENVVSVSEETEPSPQPPLPPTSNTQNIIDTDDLLVKNPIIITFWMFSFLLLPITVLKFQVIIFVQFSTGSEHCCS